MNVSSLLLFFVHSAMAPSPCRYVPSRQRPDCNTRRWSGLGLQSICRSFCTPASGSPTSHIHGDGSRSNRRCCSGNLLFSEDLSKQDIQKIKQVAIDLLQKVKAKIAELDHWTDKQETKASVDNLIRDTLWNELPACYDGVHISQYRQKIYEYVYTRYKEAA